MSGSARTSSPEIERAREALKRGDAERALAWLEEGVTHAVEASDAKLLRHLAGEAAALGAAVPKLRSRGQALEREAEKLAKQAPSRVRRRRWRRGREPEPAPTAAAPRKDS